MGQSTRINGSDQTDPLDITIRKNYAQTKACFIVIRNLQIEVQQMREEHQKVLSLLLSLLDSPEAKEYANMVLKDFKFNKGGSQ